MEKDIKKVIDGEETKPKRKRRTKKEIEESKQAFTTTESKEDKNAVSRDECDAEYERRTALYNECIKRAEYYGKPVYLLLRFTGKMEKVELKLNYEDVVNIDFLQNLSIKYLNSGKLYEAIVQIRSGKNNHWNIRRIKTQYLPNGKFTLDEYINEKQINYFTENMAYRFNGGIYDKEMILHFQKKNNK